MVRILVADDHAVVRQGVKQIVAGVPGLLIAGEASTPLEEKISALHPEAMYTVIV